jgi:hypothetical protein
VNQSALTEVFESYFKFKIGDVVAHRGALARIRTEVEVATPVREFDLSGGRYNAPPGEIVVERMLQQCHGGVQGFYFVNRTDIDGKQCLHRFAECELESYDAVSAEYRKLKRAPKAE